MSLTVAYETLTGADIAADRVSVNAAAVEPLSPSVTVTSFTEIDGPGAPALKAIDSSTGVAVPSPVSTAPYCTNLELAVRTAPEPDRADHAVHVPSGTAVSPNRTVIASDVPVGTEAIHVAFDHWVDALASSTREVNVVVVAFQTERTQSRETVPPPGEASETLKRIDAVIATACVATCTPSTQ